MIAGQIVPPGCYLSAVEILRRQYLAHLIDLAARGGLRRGAAAAAAGASCCSVPPAGSPTWPKPALADGDRLRRRIPGTVRRQRSLRRRRRPAARVRRRWHRPPRSRRPTQSWEERLADLRRRLQEIADARRRAGRRATRTRPARSRCSRPRRDAVRRRLRRGRRRRRPRHPGRVRAAAQLRADRLAGPTLEATLTWEEPDRRRTAATTANFASTPGRPARRWSRWRPATATTSAATSTRSPASTSGPADRPAYEQWRVCAQCGYVRTHVAKEDTSACPRCEDRGIADHGRLFKVLRPTRVLQPRQARRRPDPRRQRRPRPPLLRHHRRRRHRPGQGRILLAARPRHLRGRLQPARDDPALQPRRPALRPGRRTLRR